MTTLARITIALLMALFLSSCVFDMNFGSGKRGNGKVVEDNRPISSEFTEVSASEGIDVYIVQDADFDIRVEADENIIDLIGTDIREGRLRVHAIENIGRATKKVYVSLPVITELRASSGAGLTTLSPLTAESIGLRASSGGDLRAELTADRLEADASSGANIRLSGSANELDVDASSGADIRASDLKVNTCVANASSGAGVKLYVTEMLTAKASSGGDISYTGDAALRSRKSVSGSVHKY